MAQITYTDKDKTGTDGMVNKWRDVDANEVKTVVNENATILDSKMASLITAERKTESYTLVLADAGKLVEMNVGDANNLTVPPNSSVAFPIGTQILISQYGAGATTIVAGDGVTIRSKDSALILGGQYSAATLVKIAEDEWYAFGDLTSD